MPARSLTPTRRRGKRIRTQAPIEPGVRPRPADVPDPGGRCLGCGRWRRARSRRRTPKKGRVDEILRGNTLPGHKYPIVSAYYQ